MLEIGILLGAAQTGSLVGIVLLLAVGILLFGLLFALLLVFLYTLRLALLLCGSFGVGLSLGFGRFGCLFPLYFGVFSGVPGVEDLLSIPAN